MMDFLDLYADTAFSIEEGHSNPPARKPEVRMGNILSTPYLGSMIKDAINHFIQCHQNLHTRTFTDADMENLRNKFMKLYDAGVFVFQVTTGSMCIVGISVRVWNGIEYIDAQSAIDSILPEEIPDEQT